MTQNKYYDTALIDLVQGDPESDYWFTGNLRSQPDCAFIAKVYDKKSRFGIRGGRVSKLEVFRGGHFNAKGKQTCEVIAHYDRGWDFSPSLLKLRDRIAIWLIVRAFRHEVS